MHSTKPPSPCPRFFTGQNAGAQSPHAMAPSITRLGWQHLIRGRGRFSRIPRPGSIRGEAHPVDFHMLHIFPQKEFESRGLRGMQERRSPPVRTGPRTRSSTRLGWQHLIRGRGRFSRIPRPGDSRRIPSTQGTSSPKKKFRTTAPSFLHAGHSAGGTPEERRGGGSFLQRRSFGARPPRPAQRPPPQKKFQHVAIFLVRTNQHNMPRRSRSQPRKGSRRSKRGTRSKRSNRRSRSTRRYRDSDETPYELTYHIRAQRAVRDNNQALKDAVWKFSSSSEKSDRVALYIQHPRIITLPRIVAFEKSDNKDADGNPFVQIDVKGSEGQPLRQPFHIYPGDTKDKMQCNETQKFFESLPFEFP